MITLGRLMLAYWTLTANPDEPRPELFAGVALRMEVLQTLAVKMELLDERERRYVFVRAEDLEADAAMVRRRYHDLTDAPPLAHAHLLPSREALGQCLVENRAYQEHLRGQLALYPWRCDLVEVLKEAEFLYRLYDTMRDAQCSYYYVTVRRQALKRLAELAGPVAYATGDWPPHLPIDRFARADSRSTP